MVVYSEGQPIRNGRLIFIDCIKTASPLTSWAALNGWPLKTTYVLHFSWNVFTEVEYRIDTLSRLGNFFSSFKTRDMGKSGWGSGKKKGNEDWQSPRKLQRLLSCAKQLMHSVLILMASILRISVVFWPKEETGRTLDESTHKYLLSVSKLTVTLWCNRNYK